MNLKSLILILLLACSWSVFGQSPQKFKFQAVARDASNNPYTSANLAVRISLVRDGVSGQIDYSERHEVTTSPVGVFDLEIGGGTAITSSFPNVNWEMHSYYLKVDIDPNGGMNYVNLGTSQLLSVPYAIYAGKAGNGGGGGDPTDELQNLIYDPNTQTLTLTDGNTVTLSFPGGSDSQSLSFNSNTSELTISNGNTVTIPAGNGQVGPQGPAGPTGSTGPAGATGTAGTQGVAGTQGSQGPAGAGVQIIGSVANAAALNPAYAGATGDMFISQNDGHGHVWSGTTWDDVGQIQGPAGPQGAAGIAGTQGVAGATGPAGTQGATGAAGAAGSQGITGPQGPTGAAGVQGSQGVAGAGVQIVGSVANVAALNAGYMGATGDMFISQNDGHGHVWNGATWDDVGQIQGPAGPQGANGIAGTQGVAGTTGPAGTQGATGATGAAGSQGTTGPQGSTGAAGAQGPQGIAGAGVQIIGSVANVAALNAGYMGAAGDMFISQNDGHGHVWNGATWDDVGQIQGPAGPQGTAGTNGTAGAQGATGATGPAGAIGPQGTAGTSGTAGTQGATGPQGPAGVAGPQGTQGVAGTGVQIVGSVANAAALNPAYGGATGDMFISQDDGHGHVWNGATWDDVGQIQGPTGPQGAPGTNGAAGATGPAGTAGAMGATGSAGPQGAPGTNGAAGATGPAGTTGAMGATGTNGTAGATGPAGTTGSTGPQGPTGANGAAGATGPAGTYTAGTGINIASGVISSTGNSKWTTSPLNTDNIQYTAGKVGIGNSGNPEYDLQVSTFINDPTIGVISSSTSQTSSVFLTNTIDDQESFLEVAYKGSTASGTYSDGTPFAGAGSLITGSSANRLVLGSNGLKPMHLMTNSTTRMYIDPNGKVGVGTITPDALIHVKGGSPQDPLIILQGSDPWLGYYDNNDNVKGNLWYDMSANNMVMTNNDPNGEIRFNINFDYKMTIDKFGDVGIGTTTPLSRLHVLGDLTVDSSVPLISFRDGDDLNNLHGFIFSDGTDMTIANSHDNDILFRTDGATVAEISNQGLVLNGVSNILKLKVPVGQDPTIEATTGSNSTRLAIKSNGVSISTSGSTNSGDYMLRIVEEGSTGLDIFKYSTEDHWELYTTGAGVLNLYANNSYRGGFDKTTGAYSSVSDRRLKTNIRDLENTLANVLTLKPSRYEYIDNNPTKKESIGFVAQDVQEIFPELVMVNEGERDHGMLTMNYAGFGVIAVKAIQEQQLIIEDLEKRLEGKSAELDNQQQQIDALEARLSRLEALLDK